MLKSSTYWLYASDCARIAKTMKAEDKQKLLDMAKAWEVRAQEAEREEKKGTPTHD